MLRAGYKLGGVVDFAQSSFTLFLLKSLEAKYPFSAKVLREIAFYPLRQAQGLP